MRVVKGFTRYRLPNGEFPVMNILIAETGPHKWYAVGMERGVRVKNTTPYSAYLLFCNTLLEKSKEPGFATMEPAPSEEQNLFNGAVTSLALSVPIVYGNYHGGVSISQFANAKWRAFTKSGNNIVGDYADSPQEAFTSLVKKVHNKLSSGDLIGTGPTVFQTIQPPSSHESFGFFQD